MTHRIFYTVQAEQDLQQIVEFLAEQNLAAALRWLAEIEDLFALLANQPDMGEQMRTRRFGEVRRQCTGNYAVYYRLSDDALQLLRVLHAARDHESLL